MHADEKPILKPLPLSPLVGGSGVSDFEDRL